MRCIGTDREGFIGSLAVSSILFTVSVRFCVLDRATYAGSQQPHNQVNHHYVRNIVKLGICYRHQANCFTPDASGHFVAKSNVEQLVSDLVRFNQRSIVCGSILLAAALQYWKSIFAKHPQCLRFPMFQLKRFAPNFMRLAHDIARN